MSKPVVKKDGAIRLTQKLAQPVDQLRESQYQVPQLREVNLSATPEEQKNTIAVYKDLNQSKIQFELDQKKNLFIGLLVFFVLGLGIMIGKMATSGSARGVAGGPQIVVASDGLQRMIPADAKVNSSLHYQREKVCYTETNGENVCTTRESNQRY